MNEENQLKKSLPTLEDLAARLLGRESQIDSYCEDSVALAFKAIALAFEQGDDLLCVKQIVPHGTFQGWIAEHFSKGYRTAAKYMSLAQIPKVNRSSLLTSGKSLTEIYRMLCIIPDDAQKQVGDGPKISIPPEIQKLNWLTEFFFKNPPQVDGMTEFAREELKTKLKPIHDIYETL